MRSYAHILGLCPLLAVSHKLVYALCLGLCTALVMLVSGVIGPQLVRFFPGSTRLVIHMLIIGSFVVVVEVFLSAFFYELYQVLGLFVPLIITNCAILAHCEQQSTRFPGIRANLGQSARVGAAFIVVLTGVAVIREISGHGTLFADIELFLGPGARWLTIDFNSFYSGIPIVLMPCGAFFALAIVVAVLTALKSPGSEGARDQQRPLRYHARD